MQIIGPQVFRDNDAPKYSHGYSGLLACLCVAIATVLAYGYLCFRENRKRDHEGAVYEPGEAFSDKTVSRNDIGNHLDARERLMFGCNRTRRNGTLDTYTDLPVLRQWRHHLNKRGLKSRIILIQFSLLNKRVDCDYCLGITFICFGKDQSQPVFDNPYVASSSAHQSFQTLIDFANNTLEET